jgi:arylsulfatase A-like enzyme
MIRGTTGSPAVLLAVLLAVAAVAGCGGEPRAPRHVLLITVDTLRADHLSLYGYPRETSPTLSALAAESVVFERAIAQWPKTGPSFASMFTGQYPQTTGLTHRADVRVPDAYLTLPELMAEAGFTTVAVVSNGVLAKRLGWHQGFDEYHQTWKLAPEVSEDPAEYRRWLNARRVNELALPMLERHRGTEKLFAWIHYSDPHAPYLLPADVANPFVDDHHYTGDERVELENPRATALGEERELRYYVAQYDANVRFADQHVGELLDRGRALGLLDDALLIVTADHGESLGEHDYYFGHGRKPYNASARVPLLIAAPDVVGGRRVASPVERVDLYPTLLDWLLPGLEVPGLEGRSLLPLLRPDAGGPDSDAALAFSQAGGGTPLTHFRSVQDQRWKLIFHPPLPRHERPRSFEFYNLDADPDEARNLLAGGVDGGVDGGHELDAETEGNLRRLRRELDAWMNGSDWIRRPRGDVEERSEEVRKAMRALGYME